MIWWPWSGTYDRSEVPSLWSSVAVGEEYCQSNQKRAGFLPCLPPGHGGWWEVPQQVGGLAESEQPFKRGSPTEMGVVVGRAVERLSGEKHRVME